jgi:hypothetical protein
MGHLLEWYSKFNSLIIQSLSVVIGGLLVFFIYRLFFSKGSHQETQALKSASINSSGAALDADQIESKVHQILAEQKQKKIVLSSSSDQNNSDSSEIIDQLQTEIFNLKQAIKDADKDIQLKAKATAEEAVSLQSTTGSADVATYQKEIDDLKNRLSDYEVIAEDIADLHKLREENKNLLAQIGNQASASTSLNQMAPEDVQNLIQDLTEDLAVTDSTEVTPDEKDLIQQFEKSKG